jgi:aquaporin Z
MKKYLAELIATFALVFIGCGSAVIAGSHIGFAGNSLAFGLTVLDMV